MNYGTEIHSDYVIVLSGQDELPMDHVKSQFEQHASSYKVRSIEANDENWEASFEVRSLNELGSREQNIIQGLKTNPAIKQVSLLAPQLSIPV